LICLDDYQKYSFLEISQKTFPKPTIPKRITSIGVGKVKSLFYAGMGEGALN